MKYELFGEPFCFDFNGVVVLLFRIRALVDFGDVRVGDLGGFVEHMGNLCGYSGCWLYDNAKVFGNARVRGNIRVYGSNKTYDNIWEG